jgi:hypothetical protein
LYDGWLIFFSTIVKFLFSNNLVPCTTELNKVGLHLFTSEFLIVLLIVELILDEDNPKENGDEPDHPVLGMPISLVYISTKKTWTKSTGIFF